MSLTFPAALAPYRAYSDRASELAAVAEARKAREVPTEGDAWGERVARPAPRRLSGGDGGALDRQEVALKFFKKGYKKEILELHLNMPNILLQKYYQD